MRAIGAACRRLPISCSQHFADTPSSGYGVTQPQHMAHNVNDVPVAAGAMELAGRVIQPEAGVLVGMRAEWAFRVSPSLQRDAHRGQHLMLTPASQRSRFRYDAGHRRPPLLKNLDDVAARGYSGGACVLFWNVSP